MKDNDRISAAELRKMGFAIPENIPDCATVARNSMVIRHTAASEISVSGVLSMDIKVSFFEPFQWVECKATINNPAAELATGKEE